MYQILAGLDGVLCHIDDVLVFGSTRVEHDAQLEAALSYLLQLESLSMSRSASFAGALFGSLVTLLTNFVSIRIQKRSQLSFH